MDGSKKLNENLAGPPGTWLVTGAAGFIGSHLAEELLRREQKVVGLDNLSTGSGENLDQVRQTVGPARWARFHWIEGDIRDAATCHRATRDVDYILHQAALGSVPRSLEEPERYHDNNASGFINMLCAARENSVRRFVFASSSSVYGDEVGLPQVESKIGRCLSPYAATKRVNELYGEVFSRCYGMETIGLRYFNVFGPRQDPDGAYAAVIPKWIAAMIENKPVHIHGDGSTARDFCYVANVVQANLLAATVKNPEALGQLYNVANGEMTSLNTLFEMLRERLAPRHPDLRGIKPEHGEFRPGDILRSQADISKARRLLGYEPTHSVAEGLDEAMEWYTQHLSSRRAPAGEPR
jgi:UDP-N-acetylglucosamine/UDP-N-acetylgalactosamine 4-epimerase